MVTYIAQTESTIKRLSSDFESIADRVFNADSMLLLGCALLIAFIAGKFVALAVRSINKFLSKQADKSNHLPTVERYRRAETILVISSALLRMLLLVFAVYFWWVIEHPGQRPTAIIGASALFAVIAGGIFGPMLRDIASGSMMMSEHWFGVGDHIKVEPFSDIQGVVERVTLRSTRIRGINGEVIWLNNQNIQGVRITPKGLRTIAIEMFVTNEKDGLRLIEETNIRLPIGPLMVAKQLTVMSSTEVGNEEHAMWHITAIAQTAPGREWLLEKYAIEAMQEINDELKNTILRSDPIARSADNDAEQKFARAISNARKKRTRKTITQQIQVAAREHNKAILDKNKSIIDKTKRKKII